MSACFASLIRVLRVFKAHFNPERASMRKRCNFAPGCSNLVFIVPEKGSVWLAKLQFETDLITTPIFFERLHEYSI